MRNSTYYDNKPKTFRRSSKKIISKWGGNLQNVKKEMRSIYISDGFLETPEFEEKCIFYLKTGDWSVFTEEELMTCRVLLQTDQSGAEALIVAYDSEFKEFRKLFLNGVKPHVYVALKLFPDVWKKKAKELSMAITEDDIDILCMTAIDKLKKHPAWKDLDTLIKASDNWATNERYYYLAKQTCHCVDGGTEVLTKYGWMRIDSAVNNPTIQIAVSTQDGTIKFETPLTWNKGLHSGKMIHFIGEEVDQCVTDQHKMLYYSNNKPKWADAEYVSKMSRINLISSGMYCGGTLHWPSWKVKLMVAIQADAWLNAKESVRFRLAKDRKYNRLMDIVKEGNLQYDDKCEEFTENGLPVSEIVVREIGDIVSMFNGNKVWDSWLLNFSSENLITLIDELKYWDGTFTQSVHHKREEYCTGIQQNAEWIKTIAHLVNKQGTINKGYDGVFKVGLNNRKRSIAYAAKNHTEINLPVYCPTVSTGFFLIRRRGRISITGNSANYGIRAATFRMNILEKSGGKIVIPMDEAERFLGTYRGLFPEIPESNERIRQQVDKYKMLFNMFGHPYTITNYNITENTYMEYYAWPRQSTVGEITRIAVCEMQENIEASKRRWDILSDCHDSYLMQCPLMEVKECASRMKEFMNRKMISPIDGTEFSMKSETQIGLNWGPYKPEANELGLREPKWL